MTIGYCKVFKTNKTTQLWSTKTNEALMQTSAEDTLSTKQLYRQKITTAKVGGKQIFRSYQLYPVQNVNITLRIWISTFIYLFIKQKGFPHKNLILAGTWSHTGQSLSVTWKGRSFHETEETTFYTSWLTFFTNLRKLTASESITTATDRTRRWYKGTLYIFRR